MNILSLNSITKQFIHENHTHTLFSNLNYTFFQGQSYAIMAPSGKGKSTLLHLMAGIDTPTQGSIHFNTKNIQDLNDTERAQNITLLMQSSHFIKELTVHENAALIGFITSNKKSSLEKAASLLEQVGLKEYLTSSIGALSGGQRQRLALVCALMNNPTFLIADELTGNLDQETAYHIMKLLINLHHEQKFGFIITTHDPYIALYMDTLLELHTYSLNIVDKNNLIEKATT